MIDKSFIDPVFHAKIHVLSGTPEEIKKYLARHPKGHSFWDQLRRSFRSIDRISGKFTALASDTDEQDIIYIRDGLGDDLEETIQHECFHAAIYILNQRGMKMCSQSEEAYAYYSGYLAREVRAILKEKRRTRRRPKTQK